MRPGSGLGFASVLMRLTLGAVFLWAGLAKIAGRVEPAADDAARLVAVGVSPVTTDTTAVRRMHAAVTLPLLRAATPVSVGDRPALVAWPDWAAGKQAPRLAWAASIADLVFGVFLILGILTRLASLGVAFHAAAGIWLTVLAPAIQARDTVLRFLPNRHAWDMEFWMPHAGLLALLTLALALVFIGPGPASMDRALFRQTPPPSP
ncbi:MAG: DoxX family membrane protein [Phycisphaeraceae bacterium]|nr:MAG: DoxX family membrane protein [Phycisphaeraceae bacterium]